MQAIKNHIVNAITQWLKREVIEKKFISPGGIFIMSLFAALVAYSFTDKDLFIIPFIISGFVSVPCPEILSLHLPVPALAITPTT